MKKYLFVFLLLFSLLVKAQEKKILQIQAATFSENVYEKDSWSDWTVNSGVLIISDSEVSFKFNKLNETFYVYNTEAEESEWDPEDRRYEGNIFTQAVDEDGTEVTIRICFVYPSKTSSTAEDITAYIYYGVQGIAFSIKTD